MWLDRVADYRTNQSPPSKAGSIRFRVARKLISSRCFLIGPTGLSSPTLVIFVQPNSLNEISTNQYPSKSIHCFKIRTLVPLTAIILAVIVLNLAVITWRW